jgi:hypothetical protein
MSCPEEQPRPLDDIVESAWKLAGDHFENMDAQRVRMVERLVREAYARGEQDRAFNRALLPAPAKQGETT